MKHLNLIVFAVIFIGNTLFSQINLSNGLYICYPLDGNSSDFSGNSNHGTLYGPTGTTDRFGNLGKALAFNGSTDYISINNAFPDAIHFSVSVWVYHTKAFYPSCILSDADEVSYNDMFFNISDDGVGIDANKSGSLLTSLDAYPLGNYGPAITGQNLNNNWHHLVWVCDQDSQKIYIDTSLFTTMYTTGSNVGYHNAHPSIGRLGDGITNGPQYYFQYFAGKLDEFKLYLRALNLNEIKALYKNPDVCGYVESVNELQNQHKIQVYPNPFVSSFRIYSDKELKNASLIIYDITGKEIKNIIINGTEIEVSNLNLIKGMYFYKVIQCSQLITKGKIIAE